MFQTKINELKDYILQYNTYFSKGFADVYQTPTGIIANSEPVFPADNLGAYFYLRIPDRLSTDFASAYKVDDCDAGFALTAAMVLVACVPQGDRDVLLNNMLTTLQKFAGVRVTGAISKGEYVIKQELALRDKEEIENAMQNMNTTIVSVLFTFSAIVKPQKLNCLPNPCSTC